MTSNTDIELKALMNGQLADVENFTWVTNPYKVTTPPEVLQLLRLDSDEAELNTLLLFYQQLLYNYGFKQDVNTSTLPGGVMFEDEHPWVFNYASNVVAKLEKDKEIIQRLLRTGLTVRFSKAKTLEKLGIILHLCTK